MENFKLLRSEENRNIVNLFYCFVCGFNSDLNAENPDECRLSGVLHNSIFPIESGF